MTNIPDSINLLKFFGLDGPKKRPEKKYPSFNVRMMAATIDSFLAMATIGTLFDWLMPSKPVDTEALLSRMQAADDGQRVRLLLRAIADSGLIENIMVQTLMLLLVSGLCWHYWAATPGKMLMRMRVVDAKSEQPVSDAQILLRLAGYLLSALPLGLGYLWISVDKRRQGWHDKLAGTLVIFTPKIPAAHPTIPPEPSVSV